MVKYITKDGDVLDSICWKHYGTTDVISEVLKANPKIENVIFKSGLVIILPDIEKIETPEEVRIWN